MFSLEKHELSAALKQQLCHGVDFLPYQQFLQITACLVIQMMMIVFKQHCNVIRVELILTSLHHT